MFTSKANSKQKWVKKHEKRKNRSPVSTHGPCQHTHRHAKGKQSVGTARAYIHTSVLV